MKRLLAACLAAGTLAIGFPSLADDDSTVQEFATLPAGVRYPEGIAANPASGDIFVATFDFGPNANKLMRFDRHGRLEAIKDFGGMPLLGLGFAAGKLYILNMGASQLQRLPANFAATTAVEIVATFPQIGAPGPRAVGNPDGSTDTITFGSSNFPAPNAMVFDRVGNLYVSDSFQGAVYRIDAATTCATPCAVRTVKHDPLLATAGFPPFGANGLALNGDETALYIANTGDNRVLKHTFAGDVLSVLAESVHGADGLLFENGRLWVAANQGDEIVALNAQGRPIARLGGFEGVGRDGKPNGLLFPASMVVLDGWMYVTNTALPLTAAVGDEPEEDVTRWNVVKIRLPRR